MLQALRASWRQPDHYYWITALLAARGARRAAASVVSVVAASLGILPLLMVFSPAGPRHGLGVAISLFVSLTGFVMVVLWRRRHWPSRKQSLAFVAVSSISVAASALVQSNPVSGLFILSAFAALGGYLVFFHTARYLVPMLGAALATALVPFGRMVAGHDPIWASALLVSITIITLSATAASQAFVHMLGISAPDRDIEPLTGLLNREAFYNRTGAFIASRSRLDDRHLVIVVVNLDNYTLLSDTHAAASRVAVGRALRETTRRDAVVAHIAESEFLVADSFVSPDGSALVERIRSAIKSTPLRMTASIGVVSTPMTKLASCPPYDLLDELIALATTAMYEARRAGGNQADYVVCARPAALDDYPDRTEDAS